jgi:hypothetical protein
MSDDSRPEPDLAARVRKALTAGRDRVAQAANQGRNELERRRLQRDLEVFWSRLGRVTFHLNQAGEVSHPEITRTIAYIEDLERRLQGLGDQENAPAAPGTLATEEPPR